MSNAALAREPEVRETNLVALKSHLKVDDAGPSFFPRGISQASRLEVFPGIIYIQHAEGAQNGILDFKPIGSFYTEAGQKIPGLELSSFSIPDILRSNSEATNKMITITRNYANGDLNLMEYKDTLNLDNEKFDKFCFHFHGSPGWNLNSNSNPTISPADLKALLRDRQSPKPVFSFDERRKTLFIQSNNAVAAITQGTTADQYRFNYIGDIRALTPENLKQYPGLNELATSSPPSSSGETVTREGDILKVISRADGRLLYSDRVSAHTVKDDVLYFVRTGDSTIYSAPVSELKGISTKFDKTPGRFEGIAKAITIDPRQNFYVLAVEQAGSTNLVAVERESGEVCAEIRKATDQFSVTENGGIFYISSSGAPSFAQTNFSEFSVGEPAKLRLERVRELGAVTSRLDNLQDLVVPQLQSRRSDYTSEAGLQQAAKDRLDTFFIPQIEKANGIAELGKVENGIDQLKADRQFVSHLDLFESVDLALQKKKDLLKIESFDKSLASLAAALPEYDTPLEGVRLKRELAKLEEERRNLLIMDASVREGLEDRLAGLREKVGEQIGSIGQALQANIDLQFKAVNKLLRGVGSPPEVLLVASSQQATDFQELISLLPNETERRQWEERFDSAIQAKRNDLLLAQETHKAGLRAQSTQQVNECKILLEEIEEVFQEAKARGELNLLTETNPLIKRLKERTLELPEKEQKLFGERLSDILQARREALSQPVKPQATTKEARTVTFTRESFPVFAAPDLVWMPEVIPASPEADQGTLVFVSNFGQEYRPKIGNVPIHLEDEATKKAIAATSGAAAKFFSLHKRQVPAIKPKWAITEYHKQYLDEIAFLCKEQLENQRHLLILEGEGGTGKNILWSMFANATNRELFRFPCNAQMEKEDLTASKQYSAEKGTYRMLSELVRKIQTPGTIVFFDEFNALPTGTAKMLNSLFDEDRSIIVDGKTYKADPSVILVGAMNPKGYAGTKSLSTEVKGRARFLSVDYPPEKNKDGKYTSYEAEMLAKQLPLFKSLTGVEFRALWDFHINGDNISGGDAHTSPEREKAIKDLHQIVKSAARLREAYAKYQLRDSQVTVNVPFSLRESVDAATCMNNPRFANVKEAIKSVFVSKGEDAIEKANIEKIILSS